MLIFALIIDNNCKNDIVTHLHLKKKIKRNKTNVRLLN